MSSCKARQIKAINFQSSHCNLNIITAIDSFRDRDTGINTVYETFKEFGSQSISKCLPFSKTASEVVPTYLFF